MSVRTQIRDRLIVELNAAPPTGVPEATRRRYIAGEQLRAARMAVFFAKEEPKLPGGSEFPITQRGLVIAIQAMTAIENVELADDAVEPMLEHIVATLDQTRLNGLAHKIYELGTDWAVNTDTARVIVVALTLWRIDFQTKRGNLSLKQ